uniref:Uncharacterized protein n=1 Tax=Cannabis sativa TaxID=3483 RepID=A0A803QZY0_CANSA
MSQKSPNCFVLKDWNLRCPSSYYDTLSFHSLFKSFWKPFFTNPFFLFSSHNPNELLPRSLEPSSNLHKLFIVEICYTSKTYINYRIRFLAMEPLQAVMFFQI